VSIIKQAMQPGAAWVMDSGIGAVFVVGAASIGPLLEVKRTCIRVASVSM
jgi:hypothetical protein